QQPVFAVFIALDAVCQLRFPALRAQWTQQKICPSASTPCPTIRQLQCGQTGASACIAHSKLSKVWCLPLTATSNALSYSFSQTSHVAIHKCFARRELCGGVGLISVTEICSHAPATR